VGSDADDLGEFGGDRILNGTRLLLSRQPGSAPSPPRGTSPPVSVVMPGR